MATPEAREALTDAVLATGGGLFNHAIGLGTRSADPEAASVSPAWRKGVNHYIAGSTFTEFNKETFDAKYKEASDAFKPIRAITPNSGSYWNESDYYEPNWEQSFWGVENFKRLKWIKMKYDPSSMFRVWNGVGGTRPETPRGYW